MLEVTRNVFPSVTVLSVLVDAVFKFPARSEALPAAIEAVTVPPVVMPETATL